MPKNYRNNSFTSLRNNYANFQESLPRSISGVPLVDRGNTKQAAGLNMGDMATLAALSGGQIYRNPSRRLYDPELSTSAIYMPRSIKQKNRWRRWFFDHDEFIGAVLELHAELPHSRAEIMCEDKMIKQHVEDCFDKTQLFSKLPFIDLEYMKVGETFIHTPWDDNYGMWSHIIIHNPDFVEVTASPFVEDSYIIELIPDDELKAIVNSTKPQDQQLKRRLPIEVIKRVTSGRNLILKEEEVTHLARRSNPYDLRGTSIIDRLFRCYVPGTPARLADGTTKNIEDIAIGDKVISKNGEIQTVEDTVYYDIDSVLVKIRGNKSRVDLCSTEEHKYLIRRHLCACGCGNALTPEQIKRGSYYIGRHLMRDLNKYGSNKRDFKGQPKYEILKVAAKDIKIFDDLLIPISNDVIQHPGDLTENTARLLGYYAAEGCHVNEHHPDKHPSINFTFSIHEKDTWVLDVVNILRDEFNIEAHVNKDSENALSIQINKKQDYSILSSFIRKYLSGDRAFNKKLSADFLYYSKNLQLQFLIGEFRGDGWYQYDSLTECSAFTASIEFGQQLEWLLLRNGFYCYLAKKDPQDQVFIIDRWCKARGGYAVTLAGGKFAREFVNICWGVEVDLAHPENAVFTRMKELSAQNISATEIANILNSEGFVGCNGGKFYNETINIALRNNGYAIETYQYDKNFIDKDDNYFYVPVVVKEVIPYKGRVYDITVSNNHWWLAGGCFVTSNTLMYEDKLREAQITIADNFIYPLKLFKLGDPQKGWIPNESHQQALAQMLQQASLDPNFALIYHYGLQVEYLTVADKIMRLDPEWNEINNKKAIALGVSQQFITGETTYASANVGLQTQLARYKAKRDLFEISWIRNKFLKVMAERNEWYRRDKKELVGNYRVTRSAQEKMERLIIPKLVWHKKLMMRDDQAFLTFLHNVYANGKGPLSSITLLQAMGLEIEDELTRKKIQEELEDRYGVHVQPPAGGSSGLPSLGAKLRNMITKQGKVVEEPVSLGNSEFTGYANESKTYLSKTAQENYEDSFDRDTFEYYKSYVVDDTWLNKLSSVRIPEVVQTLFKKADELSNNKELELILHKLYDQGKIYAHNKTGFMPYSNFKVSGLLKPGDHRDYSDTVNCTKISDWFNLVHKDGEVLNRNQVRGLLISAFAHGQLTGYEEQGIFNIRVSNVPSKDGNVFKSSDILKNGVNMSLFLSSDFDIPLLAPQVNMLNQEDIDGGIVSLNILDPQIKPYKTFFVYNTEVSNCPIEIVEESSCLFNQVHKLLANDGISQIKFVDEITDAPEWEEAELLKVKTEYQDLNIDNLTKNLTISAKLKNYKAAKSGLIGIAKVGNVLLVSNNLLKNKMSFTESFFKEYDLFNEHNIALINNKFKYSYDLSVDELDTCLLYNYLTPIKNSQNSIIGYKFNDHNISQGSINNKVIKSGVWDLDGKYLSTTKITPSNLFLENINTMVNYSYKLDDEVKLCFGKLNV